ncbi:hypothetical protein [Campylobacter aviculae]|uniref:hypothetical protein n=1 Tax=Campylobacter aviculae TaxID=2510190 RepID=UPI001E40EE15|nr:hypothetical protein [Campylobacter aviculae]
MASSAFGDDFLAKVSNGALSDNSAGVKVLSLNEMKDVKGGYWKSEYTCGTTQCYGFADTDSILHNPVNRTWQADLIAVTFGDPDQYLGFMTKNNKAVSDLGKPYNYFTYAAVVLDGTTGRVYQQSSAVLNNNSIVRELSRRYKDQFDSYLGGLHIGRTR